MGLILLNRTIGLVLLLAFCIVSGLVTSPSGLCAFFAAALHYLFLVYLFWCCSEVIYLLIFTIRGKESKYYAVISMPVEWRKS